MRGRGAVRCHGVIDGGFATLHPLRVLQLLQLAVLLLLPRVTMLRIGRLKAPGWPRAPAGMRAAISMVRVQRHRRGRPNETCCAPASGNEPDGRMDDPPSAFAPYTAARRTADPVGQASGDSDDGAKEPDEAQNNGPKSGIRSTATSHVPSSGSVPEGRMHDLRRAPAPCTVARQTADPAGQATGAGDDGAAETDEVQSDVLNKAQFTTKTLQEARGSSGSSTRSRLCNGASGATDHFSQSDSVVQEEDVHEDKAIQPALPVADNAPEACQRVRGKEI